MRFCLDVPARPGETCVQISLLSVTQIPGEMRRRAAGASHPERAGGRAAARRGWKLNPTAAPTGGFQQFGVPFVLNK